MHFNATRKLRRHVQELKVTTFPLKEHPERAWRALAQKSKSANEADIGTDVDELLNTFVKTRTPARSNMVYLNNPKDIYTRPVLTSHEVLALLRAGGLGLGRQHYSRHVTRVPLCPQYGWGKSLEVFGPLKAFTQRFPGHQASRT